MPQLHADVKLDLVGWRRQFNVRWFNGGDLESRDRIVLLEHFSVIRTAAIEKGEQPFFIAHGSDQSEGICSGGWPPRAFRGGVSGGPARIENVALSDDVE